ncbi:hypothetical protein FACS189426_23610 [Bacteroidia bacterium]|nr:hypothetical protein FACS189426_23610 [Bacteroidia bacterium]
MPNDIQERIDTLQHRAKIALYNYNINPNMGRLYYFPLHPKFSPPRELWEKSGKYNLNIGMLYDDAMRDRLVELVQYKFREYEIDTFMNRHIANNVISNRSYAFDACKFDTLAIFKSTLDSLFLDVINQATEEEKIIINKYYTFKKNKYKMQVFSLLNLDTTEIFKQTYKTLTERDNAEWIDDILNSKTYNRTGLAELCGQIGDKRFIKPLIEALDKPDNFERETVLEALARMRVEPYHSEYVKFRMPRTMEQIKNESPGFKIDDFVYVLGTQEAFLELSKYLLSDYMYSIDMASADTGIETQEHITPMSIGALDLIRDNIENKDLQAIFPDRFTYKHPELAQPVYDWMQKNYGKYKIKRIW